jgi:hypothetical protein
MEQVFETQFRRGRTFGEDDYLLFWTVIQATKNEMKKYTPLAVNGHQTMKRHTPTNQKTARMSWGGVMTRCNHSGTYRGTISLRLGQQMRIKTIQLIMVFGGDRQQTTHNNQLKTRGRNGHLKWIY